MGVASVSVVVVSPRSASNLFARKSPMLTFVGICLRACIFWHPGVSAAAPTERTPMAPVTPPSELDAGDPEIGARPKLAAGDPETGARPELDAGDPEIGVQTDVTTLLGGACRRRTFWHPS